MIGLLTVLTPTDSVLLTVMESDVEIPLVVGVVGPLVLVPAIEPSAVGDIVSLGSPDEFSVVVAPVPDILSVDSAFVHSVDCFVVISKAFDVV